ncbi:MAG: DsbA family protein [Polyangiaceae bacterium]
MCRPTNTRDAHRLLQSAVARGLADKLQNRLMRAYFTEGAALGDVGELVRLATEVGVDAGEAQSVLTSSAFTDEVVADERRALELGYRGVPAFLFGEKVQLSGAQEPATLLAALQRARIALG